MNTRIILNLFIELIIIEIVFTQFGECKVDVRQFEGWNPFDTRKATTFKYKPNHNLTIVGLTQSMRSNNENTPNIIEGNNMTTIDSNTILSTKTSTDSIDNNQDYSNKFENVPEKYRKYCTEKSAKIPVYAASNSKSGLYAIFLKDIIAVVVDSNQSNHYPFIEYLRDPEIRWPNSNIDAGFLLGDETHLLSLGVICVFVDSDRIKCLEKHIIFPALKDITPISAFGVQDSKDKSRWFLVADSKEVVSDGSVYYLRHIIEGGKRLIKNFTIKHGSDAAVVYLRENNFVEGYSLVGNSYYKFMFLTNSQPNEKSEIMRMLWGANQEFIGCPKPICHASVIDTLVKLKDGFTWIFVGKYYWKLEDGIQVSKALIIDPFNPFDTHFPYLASDIESSFYDEVEDQVFFIKRDYVYAYKNTGTSRPTSIVFMGQPINEVFRGIPGSINAAFLYRPNSTVYFFRGFYYWAYDFRAKTAIAGYPRSVTDFEDMPPNIDAILSDNNGNYYVFFGTFFANFTENSFKIGLKLEFKVSNVDFFHCSEKYFDDYRKYKNDMENMFPVIPAKTILKQLPIGVNEPIPQPNTKPEAGEEVSKTPNKKSSENSFLITFSNLILFGPFLYQPFLADPDLNINE